MGLPRSIIKQYGVSKKAWAVFRSRKRGTRRIRSVSVMPRRRSYRRSYPRYTRRRSSSGGFGFGRLLSKRNLMYTVGAVFVGSMLGVNPKLSAGAGGLAGAGVVGGVAGYLLGDKIAGFTSSIGGGMNGGVYY